MATRNGKLPVPLGWHPSLKKAFNDADLWCQNYMVTKDRLGEGLATLRHELDTTRPFIPAISTLLVIAHAYAAQSCARASVVDPSVWSAAFNNAINFRALDFRKLASLSLPHAHQPVFAFSASMKAVGPALLSQWSTAEILAKLLISVAEKELKVSPSKKTKWQRGTHDAFLVHLLSEAFSLPTSFESMNPIVPEYAELLQHWRTEDAANFRKVMSVAAEFHILRSGDSTDRTEYEFDYTFDRIYPAELLAVQAIRRRDGLPEFETGHLLIDKPWSMIRDIESSVPHPLVVETEAMLRRDRPDFR
ncbi:hypothetical protein [Lysobacter sp. CA196]|uniref:hypothetical protein n=1 Tax=Lysobacter sp. CA196 TaxID=3455606 RepID=UPI003F8CF36E